MSGQSGEEVRQGRKDALIIHPRKEKMQRFLVRAQVASALACERKQKSRPIAGHLSVAPGIISGQISMPLKKKEPRGKQHKQRQRPENSHNRSRKKREGQGIEKKRGESLRHAR